MASVGGIEERQIVSIHQAVAGHVAADTHGQGDAAGGRAVRPGHGNHIEAGRCDGDERESGAGLDGASDWKPIISSSASISGRR
jgi:hypothetical protein